jgi:ABC-type polysaccharide/polyol phosphate export permease
MFYATGIFYNVSTRIPKYGRLLCKINPVAFLIDAMRHGLIFSQTPNWKLLLIWLGIGVLLSLAGIRKIYKEENSYVKAI